MQNGALTDFMMDLIQIMNWFYNIFGCTFPIHRCKVLVVGGGSGGCAMAAKFTNKFGKDKCIIVEPSEVNELMF